MGIRYQKHGAKRSLARGDSESSYSWRQGRYSRFVSIRLPRANLDWSHFRIAAEQNITPWQNDADISQCPLCGYVDHPPTSQFHLSEFLRVSFHPITNRKHHCRLCGRIICSLPVKHPQRPVTCSLLFISDPKSGQIEEVKEGVDYGVRRRTLSSAGHGASRDGINPDEKFLRGIRICRDCRPALL